MDPFARHNNYWDIAQQPASFSTLPDDDFLALLQKQFPTTIGSHPKPFDGPQEAIDPQSISSFSIPNGSPPSSDSSPSPPSASDLAPSSSRRHSGTFNSNTTPSAPPTNPSSSAQDQSLEEQRLKRKASDEDMDDEPTHKNPHTSSPTSANSPSNLPPKKSSSSRRKSTGNPQQDEYRLLKRKEQNRAAQRAFRERKEKHVKDLEDKLADLEAKNQAAVSENENLRDLLSRLQQENMALKAGTFDFRMPKVSTSIPQSSFNTTPTTNDTHSPFSASSPVASSSKSSSAPPQPQSADPNGPASHFDFNFGTLIPFDPQVLNMLDETQPTATDGAMNMDYGFGPMNGVSQYRTLASDPTSMSFAEPMPYDMSSPASVNGGNTMADLNFASFGAWSPPASSDNHSMESLDQLFGGNYMGAQSPVDFSALLRSPPSSISPVSHSLRSNNSGNSNGDATNGSTPGTTNSGSSAPTSPAGLTTPTSSTPMPLGLACAGSEGGCPKTREAVKKAIEHMGSSQFVEDSGAGNGANGGFVKKAADPIMGPMVMCKGSSFPKTEQSDKNIEVLAAWRSITSDPQFKDVDINELCQEFTAKARCDGTKVVLEPEGVHHIIETLAARRQMQQQKSQSQQAAQTSSPSSQN